MASIPLRQIERIVIGAPIDIPSTLLLRLVEHGIALSIIHTRRPEHCVLLTGMHHNDAWRRQTQYRLVNTPELCGHYATQLVRGKLRGQRRVLLHLLTARPDQRQPLFTGIQRLNTALDNLAHDRSFAENLDRLRGLEGAGAAAYFAAFTSVFAPALEFTGRNRQPPRDPVNVALSLSYTLAHSEAERALVSVGLDPALGMFHSLDYGRPSLACDLVELLRPIVDAFVWSLFRDGNLRPEHFSTTEQGCQLGKAGRSHYYAAWSSQLRPLVRHTRRLVGLWLRELRKLANHRQPPGDTP